MHGRLLLFSPGRNAFRQADTNGPAVIVGKTDLSHPRTRESSTTSLSIIETPTATRPGVSSITFSIGTSTRSAFAAAADPAWISSNRNSARFAEPPRQRRARRSRSAPATFLPTHSRVSISKLPRCAFQTCRRTRPTTRGPLPQLRDRRRLFARHDHFGTDLLAIGRRRADGVYPTLGNRRRRNREIAGVLSLADWQHAG
jgi:hypothetical protein